MAIKTILVIDDDPDVHYFCKSILEAVGYRLQGASSGEQGLRAAAEARPDLVILDVMMERIDTGYSVAEQLGKDVPVLLISSMFNESDQVFDPGVLAFSDMVRKPLDAEVLLKKVRTLLGE